MRYLLILLLLSLRTFAQTDVELTVCASPLLHTTSHTGNSSVYQLGLDIGNNDKNKVLYATFGLNFGYLDTRYGSYTHQRSQYMQLGVMPALHYIKRIKGNFSFIASSHHGIAYLRSLEPSLTWYDLVAVWSFASDLSAGIRYQRVSAATKVQYYYGVADLYGVRLLGVSAEIKILLSTRNRKKDWD